jgi:hypothetical protein
MDTERLFYDPEYRADFLRENAERRAESLADIEFRKQRREAGLEPKMWEVPEPSRTKSEYPRPRTPPAPGAAKMMDRMMGYEEDKSSHNPKRSREPSKAHIITRSAEDGEVGLASKPLPGAPNRAPEPEPEPEVASHEKRAASDVERAEIAARTEAAYQAEPSTYLCRELFKLQDIARETGLDQSSWSSMLLSFAVSASRSDPISRTALARHLITTARKLDRDSVDYVVDRGRWDEQIKERI